MSTEALRPALVAIALLAAVVTAAEAQLADERRGLWVGAGAGFGSAEGTCSICLGREAGPAGLVRVGGTLSGAILAGLEGTGWRRSEGSLDRSFIMVAAVGAYYPIRNLGLHVKGGLGQYWYFEEDAATELSTQGLALEVGVGFDVRIAAGVSLSPFGSLMTSGFGNPTRLDKASGIRLPLLSDMTVEFFSFGLAVTLH